MNFRIRGHPREIRVRAELQGHPVVDSFAKRFNVDHEHAQNVVTESVLDAMDLLGTAYVNKMTRVVTRMAELREAIHFVYEKVLSGTAEPLDAATMRQAFDELHAQTKELADPKTWAERDGGAIEPLPPLPRPEPPRPTAPRASTSATSTPSAKTRAAGSTQSPAAARSTGSSVPKRARAPRRRPRRRPRPPSSASAPSTARWGATGAV